MTSTARARKLPLDGNRQAGCSFCTKKELNYCLNVWKKSFFGENLAYEISCDMIALLK